MPEYTSIIFSKLPSVKTSIFTQMASLTAQYKAVNMAQGFPDFDCNPELVKWVNHYMAKGANQYAPMPGVLQLREKIVEKTAFLYQTQYHPENEITITSGATQALYTAISTFIREGDEVIVFEPTYDAYVPTIKLNGGNPVFIELSPDGFSYDWELVKRAINQQTKMIIINNPMNPSGRVLNEHDLLALQRLTDNTEIIVLADEVYEHMVYDGKKHLSVASNPNLAARSIVVSSFGKTYHTTGWKIGYCLAPEKIMREFRKVHQFNVFAVNTPIQYAYAAIMEQKELYTALDAFYQNKRDTFNQMLKGSRLKFTPTEGTYFQTVDYSAISDLSDIDFANHLVKDKGISVIPYTPFYHLKINYPLVRLCFAKSNQTLEQAAEILCKL